MLSSAKCCEALLTLFEYHISGYTVSTCAGCADGRDGVILACEILDCCPWFEFADLDVYVSDEDDEEDDDIEASVALPPDAALVLSQQNMRKLAKCC